VARFDDRPDEEPDDPPDERADDRDEEELTSNRAAVLAEREESLGHEKRFEDGSDDGRKDAGYDAHDDVVRSPPHRVRLRVEPEEFMFLQRPVSVRRASNRAEFDAIAADFARGLRPGDVVALEGDLGAGKTTFVAAVARALHGGADDEVASPTFTFWHRYAGAPPLEHLDLYRVERAEEAVELGLEEALRPESIAFVEWPDRLPGFVPPGAWRVRIAGSGDAPRDLEIVRPR
jgi:tRNA threonylcarbamoyladenosine biosynthesis protein TsaE